MADLKVGDIREFWGYGPCVILDVTSDNYYVLTNYGNRDLISKKMEYKSVHLDKEHRDALYEYYLTYRDLGKANEELRKAESNVRKLDKALYDKGELICKKYGDMAFVDFLTRVQMYGKENFKKLESCGYKYLIEENKDNHSLKLSISLCRPVKTLRDNPDYIQADFDDSALIVPTKQYDTDMKKYSDMYCVELENVVSSNALVGKKYTVKKLEMSVGPLYLMHSVEIYTPFIHYTDKTARLISDLFKIK